MSALILVTVRPQRVAVPQLFIDENKSLPIAEGTAKIDQNLTWARSRQRNTECFMDVFDLVVGKSEA